MKPVAIDDIKKYSFLSGVSYSQDGKTAVFVVKKAQKDGRGYTSDLYMYRSGEVRRLTSGGKEGAFAWKNDNELFVFTSREEEDKKRTEGREAFTPLYTLRLDGGEAEKTAELPFRANSMELWHDSVYAVSGSISKECPDYYRLSDDDRKTENDRIRNDADYEICDEVPFWFNGAGFINGNRSALFLYNEEDGSVERINDPDYSVGGYELMEDRIIYWGNKGSRMSDLFSTVFSYSRKDGKTTVIRDDSTYSVSGSALLDGRLVLLMSDGKRHGMNQDPDFYWFDPDTGKEELLYKTDTSVGNSTGSDCRLGHGRSIKNGNRGIYFTETRRNSGVLCCLTADGEKKTVIDMKGSVDDFDISEETGSVISVRITAGELQELFVSKLEGGEAEKVSDFNGEALRDTYVALPEKFTFDSEGWDIDGWVLKPIGYDPEKRYPAVLDIHGGPKTVYGEIFFHEMQYWAGLGYFVFFCNPIGSDGRGDEFADIRGKYGTCEFKNIMDFTDEVLKRYPQIDENRVCVTGGSYGGFMTNWIVGHTDRYCCAATQRSISNWISFEGVSDIGPMFTRDQQCADLFSKPDLEKLWWHSPLKYADDVKTPTLFIHSDQDYRCPFEQGIQFFTALKTRDVECRMAVFHGENHELSRGGMPEHRVRRLKEITDWFNSHT